MIHGGNHYAWAPFDRYLLVRPRFFSILDALLRVFSLAVRSGLVPVAGSRDQELRRYRARAEHARGRAWPHRRCRVGDRALAIGQHH